MKKITVVSIASFIFLLTCSLVAKITMPYFLDFSKPLIIGISILAASGILAFLVRDNAKTNIVCAILSAVAMGFVIRAWYILRGIENSLFVMLLISLGAVAYLWIYFALIRIPIIKESAGATVAVTALYTVISILVYVLLVLGTKTTFVSTVGFYAFIELSFIFAMSLEVNNRDELIRNLTISTYSVLIVAIVVIVVALVMASGEGDCDCSDCDCGGCDCGSSGSDNAKNKVAKRTRNDGY